MILRSAAFKHRGKIPKANTCDGEDASPSLTWLRVPKGTESFALVMDDPDAPAGTWVHWLLYDVPADTRVIEGGMAKVEVNPDGASQGLVWGVDAFERVGYWGPCPPPGKPHRYVFTLYALDRRLGLAPRATKPRLLAAMEGHVLAEARLIGLYGR